MSDANETTSEPVAANNIGAAKIRIMRDAPYIQKTKAKDLNYTFAGEAAIIEKLHELFVREGVHITPIDIEVLFKEEYKTRSGAVMNRMIIRGKYRFSHVASGTADEVVVLGEGADAGDKATPKALTGAYKYALREWLLIQTGDDPDNDPSEAKAPPQQQGYPQQPGYHQQPPAFQQPQQPPQQQGYYQQPQQNGGYQNGNGGGPQTQRLGGNQSQPVTRVPSIDQLSPDDRVQYGRVAKALSDVHAAGNFAQMETYRRTYHQRNFRPELVQLLEVHYASLMARTPAPAPVQQGGNAPADGPPIEG